MEIWLPVKGYEDVAEVSNFGSVRTIDRVVSSGQRRKGKVLALYLNKQGYMTVCLCRKSKSKSFLVHRLVAAAFVAGSGPQVNHMNGIKTDNRTENLEWCSASDNQKHAFRTGLNKSRPSTQIGSAHGRFGGFIIATEIATGIEQVLEGRTHMQSKGFCQTCVSKCLRNKSPAHKGHTFRYMEKTIL